MKLNYSKKVLILSIVILIIVLLLNGIFLYLLINKINNVNNKVKQLNISSEKRETDLILKDSVLGLSAEREKLSHYFVGAGDKETIDFTKYLEDLATLAGVAHQKTLSSETITGPASSETVSAIRYKFNITGSWPNVYHFLLMIENMPKVISLNSVSFNVSSGAVSLKEVKIGNKIWSADLDFTVVKLKI